MSRKKYNIKSKYYKECAAAYAAVWVLCGINQLILGIVHIKEKGFLMRCSILYLIFIWLPASELTAPSDMRNKRITAGHTLAVICVSFLMDSAWRCIMYPWWFIIFAVEIVLIVITVLLVRKYL